VFERILFPTDFSEWAERTGQLLPQIPGVREVVIVHIIESGEGGSTFIDPDQYSLSPEEYVRAKLAPLKESLEHGGFSVSLRVEGPSQNIADTLLALSIEEGVSLIVLAARKKGHLGTLFLGSVSGEVLRKSTLHVMITQFPEGPESLPDLTSRLLLPVDLSRPSRATVSWVGEMGGIQEAILLHVLPGKGEANRRRIDDSLSQMVDMLRQRGVPARILIRYGRASEEICRAGNTEKASLIVLSRFGQHDYIKNILIGSTSAEVPRCASRSVLILNPSLDLQVETRELRPEEFEIAEDIWQNYHSLKADRERDRIFGVFVEGRPVAVARGKRHPEGWEVDGVFTLGEFRGRGYARRVMYDLVETLKDEVLYMHSTLELVDFYRDFGFYPIEERELPASIRDRFSFAEGNLQGVNVCPMKRDPNRQQ
jgi:nucleotide-binding universal stress UspA family protein